MHPELDRSVVTAYARNSFNEPTHIGATDWGTRPQAAVLERSLEWFSAAVIDAEVGPSIALFSLSPPEQFLAVQILRTAVRAAIGLSDCDEERFVALTSDRFREWFASDHLEPISRTVE